jgi:hypothetical protein
LFGQPNIGVTVSLAVIRDFRYTQRRMLTFPRKALYCSMLVVLSGCDNPEAVARLSSSAGATLKSGNAIFDDLKNSCLRALDTQTDLGELRQLDTSGDTKCDNIGQSADGLKAASELLADYFSALYDLASFGTTKLGDQASSLASKATQSTDLKPETKAAMGPIASFLTNAAVSGRRAKDLQEAIAAVSTDVRAVLDGLSKAVANSYMEELGDEEKKIFNRYRRFEIDHKSPEVLLMIEARWRDDRTTIEGKRNAARSYCAAVDSLAKANDQLAGAAKLRAKELSSLLGPYLIQVDSLLPAVRKAF